MTAVWAPHAAAVDLVTGDGRRTRLAPDPTGGWFRGPALGPGTRYGFVLDGDDAVLPDPRSHSQPDGIDGLSEVVDLGRHRWGDRSWKGFHLPGAVVYELHVGTFSEAGTFDGAVAHLDHLVELGVDAVELMPVSEAMGRRGWGYDGVLLYAVHHAYGGPSGLQRFVDACHRRGLGVLLDVVYNHFGPRGNHLPRFGPYLDDRSSTPWGQPVNLDGPGSDEVRRFVIDNARHWFERFHLDGLRLDATHALVDGSPVHLVAELAAEIRALAAHLGRPLWLVAEREQNELLPVLAPEAGGWGLDGRWSDDLHHALHVALTGERLGYYAPFGGLADVATAIERVHVRRGDEVGDRISRARFVTCSQNHDQVGNRALGDRLSCQAGPAAQLVAAAIVLCAPGTPLLFQGEEWAASSPFPYFCDVAGDEGLAEDIREGRRREFAAFGWEGSLPDPSDEATFESARLRWDERDRPPHREALAFYRALLRLRRARPDLSDGRAGTATVDVDEQARTLVLRRGATLLVANLASEPRTVRLDEGAALLLATDPAVVAHGTALALPATAVAILDAPP